MATPRGASTALCQNEYANADLTTRSALMEHTPLECDIDLREITWKSDNPDAQLVRIRVGRCMAYDDHCMKWSRVQL